MTQFKARKFKGNKRAKLINLYERRAAYRTLAQEFRCSVREIAYQLSIIKDVRQPLTRAAFDKIETAWKAKKAAEAAQQAC